VTETRAARTQCGSGKGDGRKIALIHLIDPDSYLEGTDDEAMPGKLFCVLVR
jgi:hypothetical protein